MKNDNEDTWNVLIWWAMGTVVFYLWAFQTPEKPRQRTGTAIDYGYLQREQAREELEKIRKERQAREDRYWSNNEYTNYHIF